MLRVDCKSPVFGRSPHWGADDRSTEYEPSCDWNPSRSFSTTPELSTPAQRRAFLDERYGGTKTPSPFGDSLPRRSGESFACRALDVQEVRNSDAEPWFHAPTLESEPSFCGRGRGGGDLANPIVTEENPAERGWFSGWISGWAYSSGSAPAPATKSSSGNGRFVSERRPIYSYPAADDDDSDASFNESLNPRFGFARFDDCAPLGESQSSSLAHTPRHWETSGDRLTSGDNCEYRSSVDLDRNREDLQEAEEELPAVLASRQISGLKDMVFWEEEEEEEHCDDDAFETEAKLALLNLNVAKRIAARCERNSASRPPDMALPNALRTDDQVLRMTKAEVDRMATQMHAGNSSVIGSAWRECTPPSASRAFEWCPGEEESMHDATVCMVPSR